MKGLSLLISGGSGVVSKPEVGAGIQGALVCEAAIVIPLASMHGCLPFLSGQQVSRCRTYIYRTTLVLFGHQNFGAYSN